ncbi:Defensin-like family protein [Prunus dulcis]|uniref:Defensin-like family protein n=1 Tax=Prunus dulcis TaxID=3755 RepID=A0A4Y1RPI1_PRUDU|nr:Defensin-like family protein [Prunus dulcis]
MAKVCSRVWKITTVEGSKCCTDHPELGNCVPGADDNPNGGKCWTFCTSDCEKGESANYLAAVIIAIAYSASAMAK